MDEVADVAVTEAPAHVAEAPETTQAVGDIGQEVQAEPTLGEKTDAMIDEWLGGGEAAPAPKAEAPAKEEGAAEEFDPSTLPPAIQEKLKKAEEQAEKYAAYEARENDEKIQAERRGDPEKGIPPNLMAGRPPEVAETYANAIKPEVGRQYQAFTQYGQQEFQGIQQEVHPGWTDLNNLRNEAIQVGESDLAERIGAIIDNLNAGFAKVGGIMQQRIPLLLAGSVEAAAIKASEATHANTSNLAARQGERQTVHSAFDSQWGEINQTLAKAGLNQLGDTQKAGAIKRLDSALAKGYSPQEALELIVSPYRESTGAIPQGAAKATGRAASSAHLMGGAKVQQGPSYTSIGQIQADLADDKITFQQAEQAMAALG